MDPVSSIGVAAAVVQFVQISLKALETCREIRDSANASTEHNAELETAIKAATETRKSLSTLQTTVVGRRITSIVKSCKKESDELVDLLKYLRDEEGKAKGKPKSAARLFCRTLKERRTVEKLEHRLRCREKELEDVLAQTTHTNVETVRQTLETLVLNSQTDLKKVSDAFSSTQTDLKNVSAAVSSAQTVVRGDIANAKDEVQAQLRTIKTEDQTRRSDKRQAELRQSFLDALAFPGMNQRAYNVASKTAPGTNKWIFDMDPGMAQPQWDNFGTWLREDNSVYWISGKAGSGKSTLVASIVQDPRTAEGLSAWNGGAPVHILSFYFWRPGSALQKSVEGLLRTLLHQICEAHPSVVDAVVRTSSPANIRNIWHEGRYADAVCTALAAVSSPVCLFIDGLDEYEGSYDELVDLIFKLQRIDAVKCCVSSRPEVDLHARLGTCRRLRLEDYNHSDIYTFISLKLSDAIMSAVCASTRDHGRPENLLAHVAYVANGIFLWAALMSDSLVTGVRSGDDIATLWERIDQAPKELEALFAQMMDKVSHVHKKALAHWCQLLRFEELWHWGRLDICQLTILRMRGTILEYSDFEAECQRTVAQIRSQSAGLLEVAKNECTLSRIRHKYDWHAAPKRYCALALCRADTCAATELDVHSVDRQSVDQDHPWHEFLELEGQKLSWCHRSAYEYIFPTNAAPSPLAAFFTDERELVDCSLDASLKYLLVAPSAQLSDICNDPSNGGPTYTDMRMSDFAMLCNRAFRDLKRREDIQWRTLWIERLCSAAAHLDPEDIVNHPYSLHKSLPDETSCIRSELALLEVLLSNRRWWMAQHLMNKRLRCDLGLQVLLKCLSVCLSKGRYGLKHGKVCKYLVTRVRQIGATKLHQAASSFEDERLLVAHAGTDRPLVAEGADKYHTVLCTYPGLKLASREECQVLTLLVQAFSLWLQGPTIDQDWVLRTNVQIDDEDPWVEVDGFFQGLLHRLTMIELRYRRPPRKRRRLFVLAGVRLWRFLHSLHECPSPHTWKKVRLECRRQTADSLRLVCLPMGTVESGYFELDQLNTIQVDLQWATIEVLMKYANSCRGAGFDVWLRGERSGLLSGTSSQFSDLTNSVLADIWDNAQGLNASQQLFVLACVRSEFADYYSGELLDFYPFEAGED